MDDNQSFLRAYFGVFFERQTYLNIAYMLLALPLGIVYFTLLVTGFSLGFSLAIVLVGIPILFAMVGLMQALGRFERGLNHVMLEGGDLRDGFDTGRSAIRGMSYAGVLDHIRSGQFLKSGFYLFAKFAYGIFSFSLAVFVVALIGGFILTPVSVLVGDVSDVGFPAAMIVFLLGVFGAPIGLQLLNLVSKLWRDFGISMLDEPDAGRYRYVRVPADEYDEYDKLRRKNDDKLKNEDLFLDEDPFYDDDLHIARVARERSAQDDDL
jgi:hypothetical protein